MRNGRQEWSNCPVCSQFIDGADWLEIEPLTWKKCRTCDVVFKGSEPDGFLTDAHYEDDYFVGGSRAYDERREHRVNKALRQISAAREFSQGERLLDIGCSLGYALEAGRRLGLEPIGLDLSQTARNACLEQGFEAVDGRMDELPFEDARFDLILMKHVLEHTPEPAAALREIRRVCAAEACLIIAVPNLHYIKGRFARFRHRYYDPKHAGREHYVYFSRSALIRLLREQGFEVRASSKAVFRRREAKKGIGSAVKEALWFSLLSGWQTLASICGLRRELFIIAQRR